MMLKGGYNWGLHSSSLKREREDGRVRKNLKSGGQLCAVDKKQSTVS